MERNLPFIALDFPTGEEALAFVQSLPEESLNLKVGMELYYQAGRPLVQELLSQGHQIFLDLKLHDIPNTVSRAASVIAQMGVSIINVHASGGYEMMRQTRQTLDDLKLDRPPLLIAVTQLTSTSTQAMQEEQLVTVSLEDSVTHYAKLAKRAGCDGVVCSPHEVPLIKAACGEDFLTITPGIRPVEQQGTDDQQRVTTPGQARQLGSDWIVVGRPITQAEDPQEAYQQIVNEWQMNKGADNQ